MTPGREATKRSAQDAVDEEGRIALYIASSSGVRFAREPPFTGSIITMGIFLLRRISYSSPERTTGFSQSA